MLQSTLELMTSQQMEAFRVDKEPQAMRDRYGAGDAARPFLERIGAGGAGLAPDHVGDTQAAAGAKGAKGLT